ncbi:hypothetical protein ORV05_13930 [Amycolatopsis cynarae]|uniref:Uncharacterized protein n=1 Tax=Amycolatopsis cynarae TaxID=2995223 RepID=A0ABY7B8Y9_9PSEU|nr:hypothetical protein [Amycolatopsis sp. HUAS 11-8]WAL68815.1 hypothetical protein ORV05_13930 [Amycolatopsis sp. HUAS 11-8]
MIQLNGDRSKGLSTASGPEDPTIEFEVWTLATLRTAWSKNASHELSSRLALKNESMMETFAYKASLFPGQQLNALAGIASDGSTAVFNEPLTDGFRGPVDRVIAGGHPEECSFGPFPILAPCRTWTELVEKFFAPFTFHGRPTSFAGAAVMQKHSRQSATIRQQLAEKFGVRVEDADDNADRSFVLVRVPRKVQNNEINLSGPQTRQMWDSVLARCRDEMNEVRGRLKPALNGDSFSPDAVRNILDTVENTLGSHLVESLSVGDEAFQIFVYTRKQFELICAAMDRSGWEDAHALSFRYFTSKNFLLYATAPRLASGDPSFSALQPLLGDQVYGVKESVFSLLLNDEAVRKSTAISSLTCTGAHLVSMADVSAMGVQAPRPPVPTPVGELVDAVTTQAAIARFGSEGSGTSAVPSDVSVSYASLYEAFTTATPACALWSPYVSLTQPYVKLDDFWNTAKTDRSAVRHLTVVADVIELRNSIDLSSLSTVTLTCRLLIVGTQDGTVPTVRLSASAWDPLQLYCGSMSGTCAFEAAEDPASRRVVFADDAVSLRPDDKQVAFDSFFGGKYPVELFTGASAAADARWRRDTIETGLETLLLTSAAALRPQAILSPGLKQTAVESWQSLQWLIGYFRQITDSFTTAGKVPPDRVVSLYGLATTLARSAPDPRKPTEQVVPQVPSLRFTAFQDAVNKLLDVADTYATQLRRANEMLVDFGLAREREFSDEKRDALLRETAKFMVTQNEALAKKEDDLVDAHNAVINKNNEAMLVLSQREGQLRTQYQAFLKKLQEAQKAMSDAIAEESRKQETKMVFEFVGGLVEVFGGLMTGLYGFKVAGAAEGMEKTLKKWESFLKLAETANKLIESGTKLADSIEQVVKLDNSTPSTVAEPPNDTDWEVFMNDAEAKVRPAEELIRPEVERFVASVRNLVAIAKSLNAVEEQKVRLQFNNFTESTARAVSQRQAERLRALKLGLDKPSGLPGHAHLADLGQLTAMLQLSQNRALNRIVEIAALMDDSMTYHYLSGPSLIRRFDIAEIKENLAAQALSAVEALGTYPYPPTDLREPVEIRVDNVPVEDLMSGVGAQIAISPTHGDLLNALARVRINAVDVRIEGVSTAKGQCHVQLVSTGAPMNDRGLRREILTYRMISRDWHVVYDIASDRTIIGTEPAKEWGGYFTKPTPFQHWRVLLPRTPENAGASFESPTTAVILRFHVEAMYSAPPAGRMRAMYAAPSFAAAGPDPSHFLGLLKGCSLTDGWDVASFVSVDRINDLWNQRWRAETDAAFHGDRMFVQNIDISHTQVLPGKISVRYRLEAKAGPPSLKFMADAEQSAEVGIPLLEGTLTTTTYRNDTPIGEDTKGIESTSSQPVMVRTKAELQKLPGDVDKFHAVHIDPARGVFAFENIVLDPQVDTAFCNEIVEYFKKQELQPWLLGSLRFESDQEYLQPRNFAFRTFTPPPSHRNDWPSILGIYVLTSTSVPPVHGMRQSWPDAAWPVSADFDAAVYFSADLLWNKEVLPALHKVADATVRVDPNTHQYSGAFTGQKVVSDQPVKLEKGWENGKTTSVYPHAKVTFDYQPLQLTFDLTALSLNYEHTWTESFPYQGRHPVISAGDADVRLSVDWDDVTLSCSFSAQSTARIDPKTFNVTFGDMTISPEVDIKYPIHKIFGMEILAQMKKEVVANAKSELEKKFSDMKIELRGMSMFAVSNLLFPESRALDPSGVYFPGDMAIVGQVTRTWSPPQTASED